MEDARTWITRIKSQAKNIAEEAKKLRAMLHEEKAFAKEVEADATKLRDMLRVVAPQRPPLRPA